MEDLYNRAVEYILSMPKTEKAVRLWLQRKTADKNEIETLIAKLKEYNFIDDISYAGMYVDSKQNKMAVGMIRNKLSQSGVKYDIIDTALAGVVEQNELAVATAEKYLRGKQKTPEIKGKLFRHLLTKGFSYELSGEASNECWNRHCGS
jgi:regulatory protein